MSNSNYQFTETAEDMHADAAQWEAERAMGADAAREDGREAMEEAARDARRDAEYRKDSREFD